MVYPAGQIASSKGPVYHYLITQLPRVVKKKRVWDAFLWATGMSHGDGRFLVSSGIIPEVHPTSREGKKGRKINGMFRSNEPLRIYIHNRVLNAYVHRKDGADVLLESTVMHELVHLALCHRGFPAGRIMVNGVAVEAGKAFEKAAYGSDVNFKNMDGIQTFCGSCDG